MTKRTKGINRTEFLYMGDRYRRDPFNGAGFSKGGPIKRLPGENKAPRKNGKGADNPRKTEPAG